MDCGSTNIFLSAGETTQTSYSFDVSTAEMRREIIDSISEKIDAYAEEIEHLSSEISVEQEQLQLLMRDDSVTLETIVSYKKDIFTATDAETRIKEIEAEMASLENKLKASESASCDAQEGRTSLLAAIISKMNELYQQIDPDGNLPYTSLFTQRSKVFSGSDATVFFLVRLLAFQSVLHHNLPIIIDSFRAEDLSTGKENTVIEISKAIGNQIIFTTTLKREEMGKYDSLDGVNHINYQCHIPSKLLSADFLDDFIALLSSLSINIGP